MTLKDLLKLVDTRWHDAFLRFVETGEAEKDFLEYLDHDTNCQKAVDLAFTQQAAAFEEFVQAMSAGRTEPIVAEKGMAASAAASARPEPVTAGAVMAGVFEKLLQLPPEGQREAIQQAACTLRVSVDLEQKGALKELVRDLAQACS